MILDEKTFFNNSFYLDEGKIKIGEEIRKCKFLTYEALAHDAFLRCKNGKITDLEKMKALVNKVGYYL
ncbi:hypothetical protein ABH961_004459 [Bacillus sp. RC251]